MPVVRGGPSERYDPEDPEDRAHNATRCEVGRCYDVLKARGHDDAAALVRDPSEADLADLGIEQPGGDDLQLWVARQLCRERLDRETLNELSIGRLRW